MVKEYIISEKDDSLYFKLFQHPKFKNYINACLTKTNFPHFNGINNYLPAYILCGYHQDNTIVSIGFAALYGHDKKEWAISYINVHPDFKNQGYGKKTFGLLEQVCPDRLKIGGFTPEGFLYMRPYLKAKGYEVKDKVEFYPSEWTVQDMKKFDEKYL